MNLSLIKTPHGVLRLSDNHGTREVEELDLRALGRSGRFRIVGQPIGFWSAEVITLYVEREMSWRDGTHEWKITASHSSGGRDTGAVADDIEAERNFAYTLLALNGIAVALRNRTVVAELEAGYQDREAEREEERARKEAEHVAKVEADAPLGDAKAAAIVAEASSLISKTFNEVVVLVYHRGETGAREMKAYGTYAGVRWRDAGNPITKNQARALLATSSCRTQIKGKA